MNRHLKRIQEELTKRNWTVYKLSSEADLHQQTVYNWFDSNAVPTLNAIEKICKAFEITLGDFFNEGETVAVNEDIKELHKHWRLLNKQQQEHMLTVIKGYVNIK